MKATSVINRINKIQNDTKGNTGHTYKHRNNCTPVPGHPIVSFILRVYCGAWRIRTGGFKRQSVVQVLYGFYHLLATAMLVSQYLPCHRKQCQIYKCKTYGNVPIMRWVFRQPRSECQLKRRIRHKNLPAPVGKRAIQRYLVFIAEHQSLKFLIVCQFHFLQSLASHRNEYTA